MDRSNIWIIGVMAIAAVGLYLIVIGRTASETHEIQDVTPLCDGLSFTTNSSFCRSSQGTSFERFLQTLNDTYPVSSTTHTTIVESFKLEVSAAICGNQPPQDELTCPAPDACGGESACSFTLPDDLGQLTVWFAQDGSVFNYTLVSE